MNTNIPIVELQDESAVCPYCKVDVTTTENFTITKHSFHSAEAQMYLCKCRCNRRFWYRLWVFIHNHINPIVFFSGTEYTNEDWTENLAPCQRDAVAKHLAGCTICQEELTNVQLWTAWFADANKNESKTEGRQL